MFVIYFYRRGACVRATDNLDYTEVKRLLYKHSYQNIYKNCWYRETIDMYAFVEEEE